jgi:circadian clock protein KaiB
VKKARGAAFRFRLYVVGDAQNSTQAISNLTALCETLLANRHDIEVVDVLRDPRRAVQDGIVMTPTLIKISPSPSRRIVGTLSQRGSLLVALGLAEAGA